MLQPEVIDYAVSEFRRQLRTTVSGISDDITGLRKRKEELEREIKRFSEAIACGGPLDSLVHQIAIREGELKTITNKLLSAIPALPLSAELESCAVLWRVEFQTCDVS